MSQAGPSFIIARISLFLFAAVCLRAEPFSIMVFNVENLFDADGQALFEDYGPENYTREHLITKLNNTAGILALVHRGRGPDIVLFQEIEADLTPHKWDGDLVGFLTEHTGTPVEELLGEKFNDELKGVPAHVWLYKTLADLGMHEYFVAAGEYTPGEIAHVNVTFSRFPIVESRTLVSPGARGTLETKIDVNGHPLHVFNSHWKSGASNAELEPVRIGNARVVRDRIDAILEQDPHADIVIGGDLNSQYNQRRRFPSMGETAVNDILGSQGDETALLRRDGPDLYNLWFELPENERGSDIFRGEWGTLMHLIVSRGLYDYRGVQYVDNSFRRVIVPGVNADPVTGLPIRWTFVGNGGGYSDHFPLMAWFRTVEDHDPRRFLALENPSRDADGPAKAIAIDYAGARLDEAPKAHLLARDETLKGPKYFGRVLHVDGIVSGEFPFRVTVGGEEFRLWSFDAGLRTRVYQSYSVNDPIEFYGELGKHQGHWQFILRDETWMRSPVAAGRE